MLRTRIATAAVASFAALLLAHPVSAQDTPCAQSGGPIIAVRPVGNPFLAVVKVTVDQRFADGNVIHAVSHYRIARDSAGRTFREVRTGCYHGEDGQLHPQYGIIVYDRNGRTQTHWSTGEGVMKVVNILHFPDPEHMPAVQAVPRTRPAAPDRYSQQTRVEQLGTRSINGILADGTRRTRTVPAGEEGNTQPLEEVDETWVSADMQLMVLYILDDPKYGRRVAEIEEFHQGDPDPGLFTPPADYSVREQKTEIIAPTASATAAGQAH